MPPPNSSDRARIENPLGSTAMRRVILTKARDSDGPGTGASPFSSELDALGRSWTPVHWPLIDIAPVADAATLSRVQAAWQDWPRWQAAIWVSAAAARHFFSHRPTGHDWGEVKAWCTGPGTARALLGLGVPAHCLIHPGVGSLQWDSESLWDLVQNTLRAHEPVLRVRGRDQDQTGVEGQGRDWLADRLRERGIEFHSVAVYERARPQWTSSQLQEARLALSDGSVWWFTSTQAVEHLGQLLPDASFAQARAVVTHPRIAKACEARAWGQVKLSSPDAVSVLKSIKSTE